jgi:hypothetical protein
VKYDALSVRQARHQAGHDELMDYRYPSR